MAFALRVFCRITIGVVLFFALYYAVASPPMHWFYEVSPPAGPATVYIPGKVLFSRYWKTVSGSFEQKVPLANTESSMANKVLLILGQQVGASQAFGFILATYSRCQIFRNMTTTVSHRAVLEFWLP
jgi:hypothetical protein